MILWLFVECKMILEELIARLKSEDTCWDFWRAESSTCVVIGRAEFILVPVFSRMWRKNYLVGLPVTSVNWFGYVDRRVVVFIAVLVFVWFWNNVLLRCPDNPRIGQLEGPENWRYLTWNASRWPGMMGPGGSIFSGRCCYSEVWDDAHIHVRRVALCCCLQHAVWLCNMWVWFMFDYATCGDVHGTCEFIFENVKWSDIFMMWPEEFLLNVGQNYM